MLYIYQWENKLKSLKPISNKREERRLKQIKRLNLFLLFVVIFGFIIILIDFVGHRSESAVPIDFNDQNRTIREWKQSGFVKSMDDTSRTLVMNETLWNELSTPRKESVVIFLRGYYAQQSGTKESKLTIKGDVSQKLLVSSEVASISSKQKTSSIKHNSGH
jgi:hypothetical protein